MVRSENKLSSAFSWADEVEKEAEEAAAAQTRLHQKQKPNPFGSARPREVVLQERGIDWRNLDQDLQQAFHKSYGSRKEKLRRENVPAAALLAVDRKEPIPPSRGLEWRREKCKNGVQGTRFTRDPLISLNQIPSAFVPPLSYPPKNVVSLVDDTFSSRKHQSVEIQQRNFLYNHHTKLEFELKQFHKFGSLRPSNQSHQFGIGSHFYSEWESKHAVLESGERDFNARELRGRSMEALHTMVGKSAACEEWQGADSCRKRRKFCEQNLMDSTQVDERRGAFAIYDKRSMADGRRRSLLNPCNMLPSADERNWKNIEDRNGRGVVRGCLMNPTSIEWMQNGRRRWNHYDSEN